MINPHTYGHLIFDKGGKDIPWRKDNLFNKWCWENWSTTCKRVKLEHFLEKAMAPDSSTLAWKISWTEEPDRLQSYLMGYLRVGHDWVTSLSLSTFMNWRRKWQPTPVLSWRLPGTAELGRLPSMGSHRVGHGWSDLAAVAEHFLTPYTKINSKRIKDLNIRPETIKLLEENIGKTLSDIHHSRILYDPPPRILEIKAKINKWGIIKIKSFCTTKELLARWKDSLQNGRK